MNRIDSQRNRAILAGLLILAGVVMLVLEAFGGSVGMMPWPFFVILPGVALLAMAASMHWNPPLAATGAIVTGVGLILLGQSITGYYRSWAYAWTLLPLAAGAALAHAGAWRESMRLVARGRALIKWSATAFVAFAALFELVFFDGGHPWIRWVAPLALVGVGALLLIPRAPRPDVDPDERDEDGL
ncbi:MAG: hypothetical protein KKH72_11940 [Alphaproteobacteria bacterium]|nr:hypothetical protein [Alphaproteobacteria bacterium]